MQTVPPRRAICEVAGGCVRYRTNRGLSADGHSASRVRHTRTRACAISATLSGSAQASPDKYGTDWNSACRPLSQECRPGGGVGESVFRCVPEVIGLFWASRSPLCIANRKPCCLWVPPPAKRQCIFNLVPRSVWSLKKKACNAGSECGATAFHTSATVSRPPGNTFDQGERFK